MKPIVFLLIICAAVFLVCFLIDTLIKKLFPKSELEKNGSVVRLPRRAVIFGVLLVIFPITAVLLWIPHGQTWLRIGCGVVLAMGVILLGYYFSFSVHYNNEGFQVRDLHHKKRYFTYAQIRGQQSLLTRSGVNVTLFVGEDTVMLTSAMQNVSNFLSTAFFRWCDEKGVDPDSVENNPRMLTYFPEP